QQGREPPEFFVGTGFAGVSTDASFDGQHVLAQRFGLRVFADKIPGVFAGRQEWFLRVHSNIYWSTGIAERENNRRKLRVEVYVCQETQAVQLLTITHFPIFS